MITIRPGSHTQKVIELLSAAGEFPWRSLDVLGNERSIKALIHRLTSVQEFRFGKDESVHTGKLLQITGKGELRTIRFYKAALPILETLHPDALSYYLNAFNNHKFPGDSFHKWRNHRVAEAIAICQASGIEFLPYSLPALQKDEIKLITPDSSCFYIARDLKKVDLLELNKTMYTHRRCAFLLGRLLRRLQYSQRSDEVERQR